MKFCLSGAVLALCLSSAAMAANSPKSFVTGLKNPESVCYGLNGLLYVTEIGESGKDRRIQAIDDFKGIMGRCSPRVVLFLARRLVLL